jgi:hypothetical protein
VIDPGPEATVHVTPLPVPPVRDAPQALVRPISTVVGLQFTVIPVTVLDGLPGDGIPPPFANVKVTVRVAVGGLVPGASVIAETPVKVMVPV